MQTDGAILIAVLVLLVLLLACQGGWGPVSWGGGGGGGSCGGAETFHPGPLSAAPAATNPRAQIQGQIEASHAAQNGGYDHRMKGYIKPEQIAEAEQEQWYAMTGASHTGDFDTEMSGDMAADTMQYHSVQPGGDYDGYITDLIVDARTKENHALWAKEMKPWSGSGASMRADEMDEAMEASTPFVGMRRPQPVAQFNPLQITERDASTFAGNPKYNFRG